MGNSGTPNQAAPGIGVKPSAAWRPTPWKRPLRSQTPSNGGDLGDLRDELGDLLFQVVFHARMAEEAGKFDFADVVHGICAKMVRRHPHVYPVPGEAPPTDLHQAWDAAKQQERLAKAGRASASLLDLRDPGATGLEPGGKAEAGGPGGVRLAAG